MIVEEQAYYRGYGRTRVANRTPRSIGDASDLAQANRLERRSTAYPTMSKSTTDRVWTDISGRYQVAGSFVGLIDGEVKIRRSSTRRGVTVSLNRLSAADQQYVLQIASK